MKTAYRFLTKNIDSFFVGTIVLSTNFGLFMNILGKDNVTSLVFKSSFVFLAIWLLVKSFSEFKRLSNIKQCLLNSPYFKSLFLIFIFTFVLLLSLGIPAFINGSLSFSYLIKFIQCVFALVAILLFCSASVNKYIIRSFVIMSVGFSIFLLFGYFVPTIRNKVYTGAVTYNLGNPNTTASVLMYNVLTLFYGIFIFRSITGRVFLSLVSASIFVLIYFTQSRNPYVALFVATLLLIVYCLTKKFKSRKLFASFFLVTSILLFASIYFLYFYFESHGAPAQSVVESTIGKGYSSRYSVWTDAFKKIGEHFFVGNYFKLQGSFQYHNSILDIFVAYGFIGGTFCCGILIYIIYRFIFDVKRIVLSQKVAVFCFIAFFYTGLFEASFFNSAQGICVLFFAFLSFAKTPLTTDCVSENNAIYFNENTFKTCDVVIVNSVYQKGSTGKIVDTIFNYSSKEYKTICLYGRKKAQAKLNVAKCCNELQSKINHVINLITRDSYLFNLSSTFEIIRVIKKYKPRLVHIHNLNDYYVNQYMLLKFLKKKKIKTIVTLHSENFYVGCQEGHVFECEGWANGLCCKNCNRQKNGYICAIKWNRMYKTLQGFDDLQFTAVSPWLADRAKRSTLLKRFKVDVILNGVDDLYFEKSILKKDDETKKTILFVCADAQNPIKGFDYFKRLAELYIDNKEITFTLLSLEKVFPDELPDNIVVHEPVKRLSDLKHIYESATISLVLSKKETFSMPVAESLSCGTPVVGFKCGGAESIGLLNYSLFVNYGDIDGLKSAIDTVLKRPVNYKAIIEEAYEKYSASKMWSNYNKLYFMSVGAKFLELKI